MDETIRPRVLEILVQNHDRFLRFLQPRLGSRQAAEEVLQAALLRGIERGDSIRDEERVVAWFYRVLRNAIVDHHRHRQAETRALHRMADEMEPVSINEEEFDRTVCACIKGLLPTLKAEYAEILRKIEIEGIPVGDVAREEMITPNNAMVRLHRARKALERRLLQTCGTCTEHGCLDCHCKHPPPA